MRAGDLINRIEQKGLLDPEIIETLREQLAESRARVTPEALAKLLVDNGQLTSFQARTLISELREGMEEEPADSPEKSREVDMVVLEDAEETPNNKRPPKESGPAVANFVFEDEPAEAAPEAAEEVVEVEVVEADQVDQEPPEAELVQGPTPSSKRGAPAKRKQSSAPKKNVWDSFKIYGYGAIFILLCLSFWALYSWLSSDSKEQYLKNAEDLYKQQDFAKASEAYENILKNYPEGRDASKARVRTTFCKLMIAKQQHGSEPDIPSKLARELMPNIEQEEALNEERDNFAGYLIDLAESLARLADNKKNTEEKQKFIGQLDQHMELVNNPTFIPTSIKNSLQGKLEGIAETRTRVMRDIGMDETLKKALAEMESALAAKNTLQAYQARQQAVRAYPPLVSDPSLLNQVVKACSIQRELVKPNQQPPKVLTEAIRTNVLRSIDLANQAGEPIVELEGQVYYARTRGSIIGLAAHNGKVLWRQYVGFNDQHAPTPFGDQPSDGVLLSDGERLEVQKLNGADGKIVWRTVIGEEFSQPVIDNGTVYLTTLSGKVLSLDGSSGDARWVTQLPQPCVAGPGIDRQKGKVYVVADHSNLYVLENSGGKCVECFYVGHEKGAVVAPATPLLEHVFVAENPARDFANVHVYGVNENGLELKATQPSFRLTGNIKLPLQPMRRQLQVLSDRGHVVVLDIEKSSQKEKVTIAATSPANSETPKDTFMTVDRSQMWVASSRLTRYELQINTGKVIHDWSKYEGDDFTVPPRLMGPALITSRNVQGSSGLRVSAFDPKTGDELWRSDIGVPTSLITFAPDNNWYGISGQGALYLIDRNAMTSGATAGPIEHCGIGKRGMSFADPQSLGEGKWLLNNRQTAGQMALFDPSRPKEKIRLISVPVGSNVRLSAPPLRIGDGVVLLLDSGRILYVNWRTGVDLVSPFQAPIAPGQAYHWTKPVLLNDGKQFVVADSNRKIRRISVEGQLRSAQEAEWDKQPLGGAALVNGSVLFATKESGGDSLTIVDVNSLEETGQVPLGGRVMMGPISVPGLKQLALVVLDQKRLRAVDTAGKSVWEIPLPDHGVADAPLLAGNKLIVSGVQGWMISIDPATGKLTGRSELAQPIATTPVQFSAARLLVPGGEGAVFAVDHPAAM